MDAERAQTSIDFAIAMGVFLVALTTVVAFMPTMTQPFTGGQQNPLLADRLTAQLVDGQLGEPATPSHLDETCTWEFFEDPGGSGDCETFDATEDINGKLGVADAKQINVTLQKNLNGDARPELVCTTSDFDGFSDLSSCSGSEEPMVEGPNPPDESGSVTIGRRYARVGGKSVYVVVKVWT